MLKKIAFVVLTILSLTATAHAQSLIWDGFDNGILGTGSPGDILPGVSEVHNSRGTGWVSESGGEVWVQTAAANSAASHIVTNAGGIAPAGTGLLEAEWVANGFSTGTDANRLEFNLQNGAAFRTDPIADCVISLQVQEIPGTGTFVPHIRWNAGGSFGTYTSGSMSIDLADYTMGMTVDMDMTASGVSFTITDNDGVLPNSPITVAHTFAGGDPCTYADFADGGPIHLAGGIQSGSTDAAFIHFDSFHLTASVPEPTSLALLTLGLPLFLRRRRHA